MRNSLADFNFSKQLLAWYDLYGRKDLPWQRYSDAYAIWVSEIMLQQTQVNAVIPYFLKFMERYPNVKELARSKQDELMSYWQGLGYYSRARNLHGAAKKVIQEFSGQFPNDLTSLQSLPGVGQSTAGAILTQAYGKKAPILDGNVKRVLMRYLAIEGWTGDSKVVKVLWQHSERYLPESRLRDYTQAFMDLGATLCTRTKPNCDNCPLMSQCSAYHQGIQSQIPRPKPRKLKPIKEKTLLVIMNENDQLLLTKRPAAGVWGGLFSFLEFDPFTLGENGGASVGGLLIPGYKLHQLSSRKFVFTHYELHTKVYMVELAQIDFSRIQEEAEYIWYSSYLERPVGLAAPVNPIIEEIKLLRDC